MGSACAERSAFFGIEQYALYSGMYVRKEDNGAPLVQVEEGPCMGRCRLGPCITVEHEDYEGRVALEGMEDDEFAARVFQTWVEYETNASLAFRLDFLDLVLWIRE
jgi:(2Fe-2S) ferredoxin